MTSRRLVERTEVYSNWSLTEWTENYPKGKGLAKIIGKDIKCAVEQSVINGNQCNMRKSI